MTCHTRVHSPEANSEPPQTKEETPQEEVPGAGGAAAEAAEEATDIEPAEGTAPEGWDHRPVLETPKAGKITFCNGTAEITEHRVL